MTRPAVTFGDPERKVISYLRGLSLGATIDTDPPSSPLGIAKYIQVEADGSPAYRPTDEPATIRVTCYVGQDHRTDVKALASLVQSKVYTYTGDSAVYGVQPLVGRSGVIEDPDTTNLMVWFTFRVTLAPTPVV